jgi:hypothetical protein
MSVLLERTQPYYVRVSGEQVTGYPSGQKSKIKPNRKMPITASLDAVLRRRAKRGTGRVELRS